MLSSKIQLRFLCLFLLSGMIQTAGCTKTITVQKQCQQPELNPILSVIPEPNFSQRLKEVWISQKNVTH